MKEICIFFLQIVVEVVVFLFKIDIIVMVGDDRIISEVSRLVSQLLFVVQVFIGIDFFKVSNESKF